MKAMVFHKKEICWLGCTTPTIDPSTHDPDFFQVDKVLSTDVRDAVACSSFIHTHHLLISCLNIKRNIENSGSILSISLEKNFKITKLMVSMILISKGYRRSNI
jgi:hypothetical protein